MNSSADKRTAYTLSVYGWHSCLWSDFSHAKSSPFHTFPTLGKTWPPLCLYKSYSACYPPARHAACQSSIVCRCSSHALQYALLRDPQDLAIARSHACIDRIMHYSTGHQKKFCEGRCSPKHTAHLYNSKTSWRTGNFHAAAPNRTLPKSLCRSSRQTSWLRLRAWIDLNSLDKLNLQHSNSALLHSEAQNTPQFLEGCCWLAGIRT